MLQANHMLWAYIRSAVPVRRRSALQRCKSEQGGTVLPGLGGGSLDAGYSADLLCGIIDPVVLELGQNLGASRQGSHCHMSTSL